MKHLILTSAILLMNLCVKSQDLAFVLSNGNTGGTNMILQSNLDLFFLISNTTNLANTLIYPGQITFTPPGGGQNTTLKPYYALTASNNIYLPYENGRLLVDSQMSWVHFGNTGTYALVDSIDLSLISKNRILIGIRNKSGLGKLEIKSPDNGFSTVIGAAHLTADHQVIIQDNSGEIVVAKRGAVSPNGSKIGKTGDLYINTSGGAGTTLWVKESSPTPTTGWVGK